MGRKKVFGRNEVFLCGEKIKIGADPYDNNYSPIILALVVALVLKLIPEPEPVLVLVLALIVALTLALVIIISFMFEQFLSALMSYSISPPLL